MSEDQRMSAFGAMALIVLVIMAVAVFGGRKASDASEVRIARIVERNPSGLGTAIIGLMFAVTTFFCFGNYYFARTTDQEIIRLLLWVANSAFWGVCLVANLLTQTRVSIVYRIQPPSERPDPNI